MVALRIGDADRDRALRSLSEHFAQGRVDQDEYDERSDAIWSAKTADDLSVVFADLPAERPLPVVAHPRTRSRSRFRTAFLPILFVLIGLSILTGWPWWAFGLAAFFFSRGRCGARSASRPERR